jgi:hypothetical protein
MIFVVPGEIVGLWEIAKTRVQREQKTFLKPTQPEAVHNGKVLEVLIGEYLASPEEPPGP